MPSSWSSEITAAVKMGTISSISSSSRANFADLANLPARFGRLPFAGGFHASLSDISTPANSCEYFFSFGGSRGESLSHDSPFNIRNFHLWFAASLRVLVPWWHLCGGARSRSLHLQHLVPYTISIHWIPHLRSGEASWPMDCIQSTTWLICCTQWICQEWLCNPESFVSLAERARRPRISTHRDASKMASCRIHGRPCIESNQLPSVSECRCWDTLPLRLLMPSTSSKVKHCSWCIIRAPWSCGSPVQRLHWTEECRA